MKRVFILLFLIAILVLAGLNNSTGLHFRGINWGNLLPKTTGTPGTLPSQKLQIVNEESVITDVVDTVSPSVVTVAIVQTRSLGRMFDVNPFDPFGGLAPRSSQSQNVEQDIGTGFIISRDGLIVTNKHVVADTTAKYKVITKDDKTYETEKIYRDPSNDLAIIKISASGLQPVTLGNSSQVKVGQLAIAIGTALGEFRNTVTVGVISGLGRGITAGSPVEGAVERLDNVIQTDAAINPGNSGGPLLNSAGQVIGINTAVSGEGQNIGFAIPINVIKDSLDQFNKTGKFQRPFLGVRYKVITRDIAILNEVPEGAYVQEVVSGSPADKAGIKSDDIITKIDGKKLADQTGGLATIIAAKKVGDQATVEIWRDGQTQTINLTIGESTGE